MSRQATCEDRIEGELKNRAEQLNELYKRIDAAADSDESGDYDEAREELDNLALSIETRKTYRVVLSTGGPHDEINITVDEDNDIVEVRYRFMDWYDGADRVVPISLDEYDGLRAYCEELVEILQTS